VLARWRKSIIGGTGTAIDITTDRIMAMGTVGTTIDRIMAMATTDRIMAMGTVGTTIVGGNPASALAAPSGKQNDVAVITSGWFVRGRKLRVRLIPDMAAKVERIDKGQHGDKWVPSIP
jgi:hypothetical protein